MLSIIVLEKCDKAHSVVDMMVNIVVLVWWRYSIILEMQDDC